MCGVRIVVIPQPSKLKLGVRFPYSAFLIGPNTFLTIKRSTTDGVYTIITGLDFASVLVKNGTK